MNATAFPVVQHVLDRRAQFLSVATRHGTIAVPGDIIRRAEEVDAIAPPLGNADRAVRDIAGKVLTAARELRETTACVIVARSRLAARGGISAEALSRISADLDEVESQIRFLRDQLDAATEDRFDAQDAAKV